MLKVKNEELRRYYQDELESLHEKYAYLGCNCATDEEFDALNKQYEEELAGMDAKYQDEQKALQEIKQTLEQEMEDIEAMDNIELSTAKWLDDEQMQQKRKIIKSLAETTHNPLAEYYVAMSDLLEYSVVNRKRCKSESDLEAMVKEMTNRLIAIGKKYKNEIDYVEAMIGIK